MATTNESIILFPTATKPTIYFEQILSFEIDLFSYVGFSTRDTYTIFLEFSALHLTRNDNWKNSPSLDLSLLVDSPMAEGAFLFSPLSADTLFDSMSSVATIDFFPPADRLVGIEPNPGPVNNKRSHASTIQCERYVVPRAERLAQKKRDLELHDAKRRKLEQKIEFHPEGLFDVGFDAETRELLQNIMDVVRDKFTDMKMEHTLALEPPKFVQDLLTWLKDQAENVRNFFLGVVKLVVGLAPQRVRDFFNAIAAFFYPEAVVPDSESTYFEAEMNVPYVPIFTALYASHFKDCITECSWSKFVSTVLEVKKSAGNTSSVVSLTVTALRELVIFLNDTFNLNIPNYFETSEVEPLLVRVRDITKEFRAGVLNEYEFASRVFLVQDEMESILYTKRSTIDPVVKERLTYLLRKFQPIVSYCEKNINPNNGPRTEPLAILIAGESGVGKSTITVPFLLALLSKVLPNEDKEEFMTNHNDFMFFRANENEFWDGYKRKNVAVVYDDFGQRRDTAGVPNPDAFELIRLKNTAPYHLHFASIEDKQRNYAAPKLIFATSNRSKLHFDSITNNNAVIRRFDLSFVQCPKVEFMTDDCDSNPMMRKLDMVKVRKAFPYDEDDIATFAALSVIEFVEWDFYKGERKDGGLVLSFDGLLKLSIRKFREVTTKGDTMLRFHQYMKNYEPEMGGHEFIDMLKITPDVVLQDVPKTYSALAALCDWCDEASERLGKYSSSTVAFVKSPTVTTIMYRVCVGVSAFVAGFTLVTKMVPLFFGTQEAQTTSNGTRKETVRHRVRKAAMRVSRSQRLLPMKVVIEASIPSMDAYLSVLRRNTYLVRVRGSTIGSVLFFSGRTFMWPKHFFDYIIDLGDLDENATDSSEIIDFLDPMTHLVCFKLDLFADMDIYDIEERTDLNFVTVAPNKVRKHKDITSFFPTERMLVDEAHYDGQMMFRRGENLVGFVTKVNVGPSVEYTFGDHQYKSRSLTYAAPTKVGDCGMIIMAVDTRLPGPTILGFHTAGSTTGVFSSKNCAGVLVYREELHSIMVQSGDESFQEDGFTELVPESKGIKGFKVLGSRKMPKMATVSKIVPSALCKDLWPTITAPAKLRSFESEGTVLNPAEIARAAYSHDEVYINSDSLHYAEHYVSQLVLNQVEEPPFSARTFTFEEAVSGINGLQYVDAINRSTSAGYPFVLDTDGAKGKSKWFGLEGPVDFNNPNVDQIRSKVENIILCAKRNERLTHVFVDCLKDERRPIEKVLIGKTRQIMTCPVDLLIAMKMYFGDFIRHCMSNRIHNGMCVGIDPFTEWGNLAMYLQTNSSTLFTAGDYSRYDGKIPVPIALSCLSIIEKFYVGCDQDDSKVRSVLFQEIINSRHLADNLIYECCGGNPSGQPLTSPFNSICNLLILTYNAVCLHKQHNQGLVTAELQSAMKRTRFAVFGDDNVIGYQLQDSALWEQSVLEKSIPLNVGMSYTNELKDGAHSSARTIQDIQFLKRSFRKERGIWVAPLELTVLKETLSWERKDATTQQMQQRIEAVLSELAKHGKTVYAGHAKIIIDASLKNLQYSPLNSTFEVALACMDSLEV